jgi:hypothetical protein
MNTMFGSIVNSSNPCSSITEVIQLAGWVKSIESHSLE